MPTVHGSAFEVGGIAGYRDQAERVGTGIAAIVERAAAEGKPVVVEGVHVVPGGVHPRVRERCVLVEALIVVDDPDLHRVHFSLRPGSRPAERYLSHFEEIRRLQDHLWERARSESVAIIDNANVDDSLAPIWAKLNDEGLTGMTMLGRHLLESGQLRDGIELDEVRDVLWNYLAIDNYERLVLAQGWPLRRYSRWLARAIAGAICP